MNFPEKGTMVKVKWLDAFGYTNSERYCINTTMGEWNGINEEKINGKDFKLANILQETSEFDKSKPGHDPSGVKIPLEWIISIQEYKLKEITGEEKLLVVTNEFIAVDLSKCPKCGHKHIVVGEHFPCEMSALTGPACTCRYFEKEQLFTWRLIY